jgi:hypothetical protein
MARHAAPRAHQQAFANHGGVVVYIGAPLAAPRASWRRRLLAQLYAIAAAAMGPPRTAASPPRELARRRDRLAERAARLRAGC